MSTIHTSMTWWFSSRSDDGEARDREATEWFVRLTSGRATDEDRERFNAWRTNHAANEAAYRKIERLWQVSGVAYEEADVRPLPASAPLPFRRRSDGWPLPRWTWAGAVASILLVCAFYLNGTTIQAWRADYATAVGAQRAVTLKDGSVLHLNTDSAVNVALSASERRLQLIQGEAIVTVAPDPARPLVLTAGPVAVRALGTEFDVQMNGDEVTVTAIEHAIAVTVAHDGGSAIRTLEAGRRVRHTPQGFGPIESVPLDRVATWRHGRLIFEAQPLADVVKELNRYRRGRIVILHEALKAQKVSAVFPLADVHQAPDMFERTLNLRVTRLTDWLVLLR